MLALRRNAPLLLLLAVAAGLRFFALSELPPAHYRDVALTATDALRAAAGHPRLHFTYDEGLYADLMGLGFFLLGASDWSVRAPGALFGVLTCWGVYRLGRALGRERAGLLGAALLAVSFWHVLLSRSGFRAILLPCLLVHAVAFLVEGMRGGSRGRLLFGGALFGLGVHVYPSMRFAPLLLPAYLLAEKHSLRASWRSILQKSGLFLLAAFVVASPMFLHYLHHPEHFTYPKRVVSVFSPRFDKSEVPATLASNFVKTLLMFHVHGDDNRRHNLAGAPMLDPLTGALFLAGLILVFRRADDGRSGPRAALLLGWLLAMLLPNILSVEGVPHGLRSSGVLPAVALMGGIGFEAATDLARRAFGGRLATGVTVSALILVGGFTVYRYFVVWAGDPQVAEDHDASLRAAARVLGGGPEGTIRLLIGNAPGFLAYGHPVQAQVYLWEMRDRPPAVLGPKDTPRLALHGQPARIALLTRDDRVMDLIRQMNPGGSILELHSPGLSPDSPVFSVNASQDPP